METKKPNEIPIYIFFAIISLCKGFDLTNNSKLYLCLYILGVIILLCKVVKDSYTIKEIVAIGILLFNSSFIFLVGHNPTPLFAVIAITCLKNVNLKNVIKVIFYTKLVSWVIMVFLSGTGFIENNFILHYRESIGMTKRFCFGYSHPNLVHIHFFNLVMMYWYLYIKDKKIIPSIIIICLNLFLYKFTISRTSFYMINMFILYELLFDKKLSNKVSIKKIFQYSSIIFLITSLALALLYNYNFFVRKLDVILTGRIFYSSELITKHPIPLIGNLSYENFLIIDNSYFSILYNGGIIFTLILIYYFFKVGKYLFNKNDKDLKFFAFYCLFCSIENMFLNPVFNFTLLFFSYVLFNKKEEILHE